ncbi:MAG: prephenate dehydratase [Candidatus Omnitrophica bacterium]|nr:prephenate dehydratase [Candidatus Omnitrophota bacterium]
MGLNDLRNSIDNIDGKILNLLNLRAKEVLKISEFKRNKKLKAYSPDREANLLRRLRKLNQGPLSSKDTDIIFGEVMSVCRALHAKLKISYLGPEGTFTHLAARKKFGKKTAYVSSDSIADVFEKVEKGDADYGVVPIENSTEGVVKHTLDMFATSPLKICSQITLNISHFLLSKTTLSRVKKIYSHPQAFAQCRKWITANTPGVKLVDALSTAKAAQLAKKDSAGACLGNKVLAQIYKLRIISSSVEDSSNNRTRFLVIAKNDSPTSGKDKTSVLLAMQDKVGALHDTLLVFKKGKINLTKIESRPSKKKAWEYYFFVDFQGHKNSDNVEKVLKELSKNCTIKILGSYPDEN